MSDLWPGFMLSEELDARLTGIRAVLRADEQRAETERRLPPESVAAFRSLDLFAVSAPWEVGGWQALPLLQMEVFEHVTRSSAAAGWNLFVGALHTALSAAYVSEAAAEAMFFSDGFPIVAGQLQPIGTGRAVDGGMVVSGRFGWGTGISDADYVLGGVLLPEHEGSVPPRFRVFVVPKDQVEVLDNWHVFGGAGSGSYDYALDEVMVPDGWWFDYPEPTARRGVARFGSPVDALLGPAHIGFGLGVGERAFEELAAVAVSKRRTGALGVIADSEVFQRELGRAYVELSAGRARSAAVLADLGHRQDQGSKIDRGLVAEIEATATWVTEVAVTTANLAMRFSGGSSIRLDSAIQRSLREAMVAQAHMFTTDSNYTDLGVRILAETRPVNPTGGFAAPKPSPDEEERGLSEASSGSIEGTSGSIEGSSGSIEGSSGSIEGTSGSIEGSFGSNLDPRDGLLR